MTSLKTLKDVYGIATSSNCCEDEVLKRNLKAEAIKWVKEDFELVKNAESHKMLERWKSRFNLTEEDLK